MKIAIFLALLALPATTAGCLNDVPDPAPLIGTWRYLGSPAAGCNGGELPVTPLAGRAITVRRGIGSDLELEVSCDCRLKMQAQPGFSAEGTTPQPCEAVLNGNLLSATVTRVAFSVARASDGGDRGTLVIDMRFKEAILGTTLDCANLRSADMGMVRAPPSVDCGGDDTAVGVLPYSATDGLPDCPTEAGRDGVGIFLDSEDDNDKAFCSHRTSDLGEGPWVLPNAMKNTQACSTTGRDTFLPFCRVDGARFKAMTADPHRPEQAYALLKLGKTCPNGSVEIRKTIDTEDMPTMVMNVATGPLGPSNLVASGLGNNATLAFCYFTSAPSADATMKEFPELGFPYAVFHDFDGPQPAWIISKMWSYSDDEDSSNKNHYEPDPPPGFDSIIENTNNDTCFDIGQVR